MENSLKTPPISEKEERRLRRLVGYKSLDEYERTGTFQHVVSMAAHVFNVPIAFVNFVDREVTRVNSSMGMDGFCELDRGVTLCSQAILRDEVTVFENAKQEPCLFSNPFVHGDFGLQFYAGAPLRTPDGFNIGVVGIGDTKPREFSSEDKTLLEGLAAVVMEELEEKRNKIAR
ncbi:GAF domain-containing protein [Pontibacter locisalis]|uniref:GAF domain-containing protein n=1 Tax=Pontibacter locisalis TaxID=1719035 RepID=A0ABW5IT62_9BACT